MAMLFSPMPTAASVWDDIQGDIVVGLPKTVQAFVLLEIVDARAFKSVLQRSVVHRATTARTARQWSERFGSRTQGLQFVGLNIAFTAVGCAKLGMRLPADEAFLAGASARAGLVGDAEPAINWLPQIYGAPVDAVILIAGSSPKAVDAEWKLLHNLLGICARVCYRESAAVRPGAERDDDHFGVVAGTGVCTVERPGLVFSDPDAPRDAAPVAWMKNGSYLVYRRIEQLVPEYAAAAKGRAAPRGMDAAVWRASRLVRRGIAYGPEVSDLERREGKTTADRGLMFVSYQTSIALYESIQRTCASPNRFAINSGAAYAFAPSISALATELSG